MQLIEVDDADGVRATVTTFTSDASSLCFVLVPVAPLAEPAHYEAVREKLRSCDVVLAMPTQGWPGLTGKLGARSVQRMINQFSRGPHLRLSTPPERWDGVDRPFIGVPVNDTPPAGYQRDHKPKALVALELVGPFMAWIVSRRGTRAELGRALERHAREALEPEPLGRGGFPALRRRFDPLRQPDRDRLVAAIQRVHSEHQGQDLRIGVVDWTDFLVAGARALGASGYNPASMERIPVFGWLPGEAP